MDSYILWFFGQFFFYITRFSKEQDDLGEGMGGVMKLVRGRGVYEES